MTCDVRLQNIVKAAIERIDFAVLCGHRGEQEQQDAFEQGRSKLRWPRSMHNSVPSKAVDLAPYPINWKDLDRFKALMLIVKDEASKQGVKLRFGWDWNGNEKADERFVDWPHVELAE
jgi:hypothetical protein